MSRNHLVRIGFVRVLWALFGLASLTPPARAAEPAWLKVQTDDFIAYSDASQKQVTEFVVQYAAFRQVFRQLFGSPDHRSPPTLLVLFRRSADFKDHAPRQSGNSTSELKSFSTAVDGSALLSLSLAGDRREALRMVIEFETTWGLRRAGYYVPLWMGQGAGKVLSSIDAVKGKIYVGEVAEGVDYWFYKQDKELPWSKFFSITNDSEEYRGTGEKTGTYHSQAWALMHWIMLSQPNEAERFAELAGQLRTKLSEEAIEAVMHTETKKFSSAMRRHLRAWYKPREFEFDEAKLRASLKIAPAPMGEVLALRADLLASADRTPESFQQLIQARQVAPDSPVVKEAWARRAAREGNPDEAARLYREAIELGTTNFMAYLQSANARLNASSAGGADYAGSGGRTTVKAIEEIKTALALNPGDRWSYQLLGRAYFIAPTITEENIKELEPGVSLGEEGEAVRYFRALLWLRLDRRDEYLADLQQVIDDPLTASNLRASAKRQLARETYLTTEKKINELLEEDKIDEAKKLFATLADTDLDRTTSQRYRRLQSKIDRMAAEH